MNFGIIGTGAIAATHARAIQAVPGARLVAVFGTNVEKTKSIAERFDCAASPDLDSLLGRRDIDIVTVATPSGLHLDPVLAAAKAGKHVICEKPLEITCARVDRMIAACAKAGVVLAGIFNRRFNPAIQALRQAVADGRFGRVTSASAIVKWWRSQEYYDSGSWRGTLQYDGGGALINQAIHTVDQLLWVVGPVTAVQASMACLAHERIEVEDTAVALLEFANGARGVIEASTSCWSSTGHPAEVQICGTHGSAFLTDESFRVWDFAEEAPEDEEIRATLMHTGGRGHGANDPAAINTIGHQRNFEDVVDAIRHHRQPLVDGPEARKAVALVEAIYQSARHGGRRLKI